MNELKPIKCRPNLYAYYFFQLKVIAEKHGYNLVVHGSMQRDLDLIAIPWIDEPQDEMELIKAFDKHLTGHWFNEAKEYHFSVLPGGRKSYVINLNRGGAFNNYQDEMYYIDISVTPNGRLESL